MSSILIDKLIKPSETCRLEPYYCPAGILTCGWGSTGSDVVLGVDWTQAYADQRMEQDAAKAAKAAVILCPYLRGPQIDAIADFVYNLGAARLRDSTLRKKLNEGDMERAKEELRKWIYGGGRKLPGLILRREAEASLL